MKKTSPHIALLTAALLASTSLVQAQPASPAKSRVEAAPIVDTIYDSYQGDVVHALFIDRMTASISPGKK